jgi:hypothetical protein
MAIDLQAKLQQSKLYFANLMDKYVDSYVFGISSDDCASNKTEYAYFLIEAIEYQMEKGLGVDDPTTLEIYKKLDCITPINNTPVTIDESLLTPISNNPITGLVVYFNDILGSPYDNDDLLAVLDSKFDNPSGLSTDYLDGLGAPQPFPDTAASFLDLTDTPDTYVGQSGKATVVNSVETGLIFVDFPSSETTSNITADLTVGGIDAGDVVLAGTNIQELAELLLTTIFYPTFVNPTFNLSNNSGIKETGSTTSFTLSFDFNRGQIVGALSGGIWNPSLFQDFRAGLSSSYTINGTTQAGNSLVVSGYTVLNNSNTFSGTVTYLIGPQPLDSKNLNYLSPYPSGTSASQSTSFTGLYPYFYYKSSSPITSSDMVTAIENGSATKVVASSSGTLAIPYNMSAQYLAVAYPSSSTTKTVYFVTTLDSGAITLVFNTVVTESVDSATGLWTGIDYKIHTSQEAITNSNTTIELRNS